MVTYPIMFLIRCALLIWAGLQNGAAVPLIVFTLLEIIPSGVLAYYILPPGAEMNRSGGISRTRSTKGNKSTTVSSTADSTVGGSTKDSESDSMGRLDESGADRPVAQEDKAVKESKSSEKADKEESSKGGVELADKSSKKSSEEKAESKAESTSAGHESGSGPSESHS